MTFCNRFGPSQIQPSVGDAGAPVFTFKGFQHYFYSPRYTYLEPPADGKMKDKDSKELRHAVLVGVISTSQYLAEMSSQDASHTRKQMSEQVVSLHTY